ncbi:histone deacetylase 11 isoform X2 [Mastomys coucha]|uniref:histone deacetylase 11 isoform X2 n=1 Tax=Mastomys coucha TaxID=35658 RepID=UPI001261B51A|nr:histone deacetylase 11 isoform X2 [Mastomys coucha]
MRELTRETATFQPPTPHTPPFSVQALGLGASTPEYTWHWHVTLGTPGPQSCCEDCAERWFSQSQPGLRKELFSFLPHATQLYQHVPEKRWPIVYSPRYNITFMGLEKLHPFDAGKWGKVINFLKEEKLLSDSMLVEAREASEEDLLVVHTRRYLNELKWSFVVATITEIPPVIFLPNFLVQRKVLRPLRTQTGGTIMAGKLAVERGWAINVGGGFHHCSSDRGGGFCAYADITLAIKFLFERVEGISRATIIDLDAHQGNGHERDFMGDKRVYIMDVYNRHIYPGDRFAKEAIRRKVELEWGTEDEEYLEKVERNVRRSLQEHLPDVVVYNAGTDVLEGDRLGGLSISPAGIVKRDEVVFRVVRAHDIPILMVTSGGYQKRTARIIADSILNLHDLGLIGPEFPCVSAQNSSIPLLSCAVP